jgi:hypothetical protein
LLLKMHSDVLESKLKLKRKELEDCSISMRDQITSISNNLSVFINWALSNSIHWQLHNLNKIEDLR